MTQPTTPSALIGASGGSYTNPDGSFNPNGSASAASTTSGTDLYGLDSTEQQWTFYMGSSGKSLANDSVGTPIQVNASGQSMRYVPGEGYLQVEVGNGTGNQYASALQLMQQFSKLASSPNMNDRAAWAATQQQLLASGFYGSSGNADLVRLGTWSNNDAQALLQAMRSYQQVASEQGAGQPISFSEYLDQLSGQSAANGQAGGSAAASYSVDDPAYIKQAAQTAAQNALGHGLSEDQLNSFVQHFQSAQATASQSNGTATPDLGADALQFAQSVNPDEYQSHQAQSYMNAFLNMFLPSSSNRPNMQPVASVQ